MAGKTLYDKVWDAHVVGVRDDGQTMLYIDQQLLHEVTSPQAFEGLALAGRSPWRIDANLATPDHNVPTDNRAAGIEGITDLIARQQVETLDKNCREYGITQFDMLDPRQGIVHVVGPEQGATLPGMTIVCGDSHTSTHGAFAALAQGIGTSDVEHVLATQSLVQNKAGNFALTTRGALGEGVSAKDLVLAIIGAIGTAGATGHTIEFRGEAVRNLSMEGRMTLCNMAIEAGARAGMVAVDDKTLEYVAGRPFAPSGQLWNDAEAYWRTLVSDADAAFDQEAGTRCSVPGAPGHLGYLAGNGGRDRSDGAQSRDRRRSWPGGRHSASARLYGTRADQPITDIALDRVFIGSCTNSRIEDLRAAAAVSKGAASRPRSSRPWSCLDPGLVKAQAERKGWPNSLPQAGFEWRDAGCSMCLAMNPDRLLPGEHCASTSNRNFEGRQGHGGRTHLVSPAMAAAAAINGHFVDVRE